MEKIITLFKRDYDGNRQVFNEIVEGAEWVQDGKGKPTKKIDGTCCLVFRGCFKHHFVEVGIEHLIHRVKLCNTVFCKGGKQFTIHGLQP